MRNYKVIITPMQQHIKGAAGYGFHNYDKALSKFNEKCEELNLDRVIVEDDKRSAGGIGYDFRIELTY